MGSHSGLPMSSFAQLEIPAEESRPVCKAKEAKIIETNLLSSSGHDYVLFENGDTFLTYSYEEVNRPNFFFLSSPLETMDRWNF